MPRFTDTKHSKAATPYPVPRNTLPEAHESKKTESLNERAIQAKIYIEKLTLTSQQSAELATRSDLTDMRYGESNADQIEAKAFLITHGLDADSLKDLFSRWNVKWSRTSGGDKDGRKRTLYQCMCGYDHIEAGSKTRHCHFGFTGCLAYVEITHSPSNRVLRVRGLLNHNNDCTTARLQREPARPLHPAALSEALRLLQNGSSLSDVQEQNRIFARSYPKQAPEVERQNHRFVLKKHDTRTLYRKLHKLNGVDVREQPHLNIDDWLNESSPRYNKTLAEAVFHYSARADRNERFEACIATPEMKEAAWKYAHRKQLPLDGTFGICDRKVLLFIAMGIDENNHGVPLAFFLFSAPSGNRQTSAGYDTEILTRLLGKWMESLGVRNGEQFRPAVAITDTDLKERGALALIFTGIILLICKFHLKQAWKNHRNKLLKGKGPIVTELHNRLRALEDRLIGSTVYAEAEALIAEEAHVLNGLKTDRRYGALAENAIKHVVEYLSGYWMAENLWRSWSDYGRQAAAEVMQCPIEGVFDLLITKILPGIFDQRSLEAEEQTAWESRLHAVPGGADLLARRANPTIRNPSPAVPYLCPDPVRDAAGLDLYNRGFLSPPQWNPQGVAFSCWSSLSTTHDTHPIHYQLWFGFDGAVTCGCQDFQRCGGACKHMRAALRSIDSFRALGHYIPSIPLPSSEAEARRGTGPNTCANTKSPLAAAVQAVNQALDDGDGAFLDESDDEHAESYGGDSSDAEDCDVGDAGDDLPAQSVVEDREMAVDPVYPSDAHAAISAQIYGRARYQAQRVMAKLVDIASILRDARPEYLDAATRTDLELLAAASMSAHSVINSLLSGGSASIPILVPNTEPVPSVILPRSTRDGRVLIPPSPEKSQRRKNSHGIH